MIKYTPDVPDPPPSPPVKLANGWTRIFIPRPSILDLVGRYMLTDAEHARVFAEHDDGDEDRSTRRYVRVVNDDRFFRDARNRHQYTVYW